MADNGKNQSIPVAVLGATGSVGQRFVALLDAHPWFRIAHLMASERSAGKPYREAVNWVQTTPIPERVASMMVEVTDPSAIGECRVAFSSLDDTVAGPLEESFARAGVLVVSNAKSHRMDENVPLLVPEVNADHLELTRTQDFGRGAILANPNCSTIGLVLALKPLDDAFGVRDVNVVTMQALSGAGLPGVGGMQAIDNVIPFIGGEEEKMEREARKILGQVSGGKIAGHGVRISTQCNRVSVIDGHTQCVSVKLGQKVDVQDLIRAWREFEGEPQRLDLPSAPKPTIHYLEEENAPQPRLHRELGNGMAIAVGRARPCSLFDFKFVTLSHNTLRGAAGGALLVAELAVRKGLLEGVEAPGGSIV